MFVVEFFLNGWFDYAIFLNQKKLYPCSFYTLSGLSYVIFFIFYSCNSKDKFILTVFNVYLI